MTHISVYAAFRPIFMTHIVTHIAFVTHIITIFCNISTFTVYPTSENSSLVPRSLVGEFCDWHLSIKTKMES